MENQIYKRSENIRNRAEIGSVLSQLANDLVSPVQDFFNGITLTAKQKFLISQLVLSILMGVVTSSQSQEVEAGSSPDMEFAIDNLNFTTPSELGNATHCVMANPDIKVNVRTGPGTNYPVLSSISGDTALPLESEVAINGWYSIGLSDGNTVWVSEDYVTKMTCGEYLEYIESNQPFVQLPRVMIGDLSIFNIETTPFSPEMIAELMELITDRAQGYEGARIPRERLAIVFGYQKQMFKLLPHFRERLTVMGTKDGKFASGNVPAVTSEVTVTPEGLLVAKQHRYGGDTYTLIFIQVPDPETNSEIPRFKLFQLLVHEGMHAKAGDIADHEWLPDTKEYDYTDRNPAVIEEKLAGLAVDGPENCRFYEEITADVCEEYANVLFNGSPALTSNVPDVIVHPPGTLDVRVVNKR